jgi:hypothetical protein
MRKECVGCKYANVCPLLYTQCEGPYDPNNVEDDYSDHDAALLELHNQTSIRQWQDAYRLDNAAMDAAARAQVEPLPLSWDEWFDAMNEQLAQIHSLSETREKVYRG